MVHLKEESRAQFAKSQAVTQDQKMKLISEDPTVPVPQNLTMYKKEQRKGGKYRVNHLIDVEPSTEDKQRLRENNINGTINFPRINEQQKCLSRYKFRDAIRLRLQIEPQGMTLKGA